MPKNCCIPGCHSRSDKPECQGVSFHALPKDAALREQWLVSIKKPITISEHTRLCSLHFVGGKRSSTEPVPTLFPWTGRVASRRQPPRHRSPPAQPKPKQAKIEDQLYDALDEAQGEINDRDTKIEKFEQEVHELKMERFGLERFAGSDRDITFYTGLPSYVVLMGVFRFIEPLLSQLNYRPESQSEYIWYRTRSMLPIDEFFMVLVRLRLGLLEQDLAHRF